MRIQTTVGHPFATTRVAVAQKKEIVTVRVGEGGESGRNAERAGAVGSGSAVPQDVSRRVGA